MKLHKGDNVKIMIGKDRGKTGKVVVADPVGDRIVVENLNMFKKRSRPKAQGQKGETVLVPRPIQASNVMLICSNCKNPTRVGFRMDGPKKVRFCKKCKATT
jgi:large subunit ribosomal protein L24